MNRSGGIVVNYFFWKGLIVPELLKPAHYQDTINKIILFGEIILCQLQMFFMDYN